ncbi:hypothetical protein QQ045_018751 [Rhodiola kirilowii]
MIMGKELDSVVCRSTLYGNVDINWLASCWRNPTQGKFIVNRDGSWNRATGSMGLGVVRREPNGAILWTAAKWMDGGSCSSEAEGRALEWATELIEREGLREVSFEMDSSEVAEALVYQNLWRRWSFSRLAPTLETLLKYSK